MIEYLKPKTLPKNICIWLLQPYIRKTFWEIAHSLFFEMCPHFTLHPTPLTLHESGDLNMNVQKGGEGLRGRGKGRNGTEPKMCKSATPPTNKNKQQGARVLKCLCSHEGPSSFLTGYNVSPEGRKLLLQNYPGKEYYITSRIMSMKTGVHLKQHK